MALGSVESFESSMNENLHNAIKQGTLEDVKTWLGSSAKIDTPIWGSSTPLRLAVLYNQTEIVKLLVERGANLEIATEGGETALWRAVYHNNEENTKYLISKKANVNTQLKKGTSALECAASWHHLTILDLLLRAGADTELCNDEGQTALMVASAQGNASACQKLLEHDANPNTRDFRDRTPLLSAVLATRPVEERINTLSILLQGGADIDLPDEAGETPLFKSVSMGSKAMTSFFIERGANVEARDTRGASILLESVTSSDDVFNLLLDKADVDAADNEGVTPLWAALVSGEKGRANQLIDRGANIRAKNVQGKSMIIDAAKLGFGRVLKPLLSEEPDLINCEDEAGRSLFWNVLCSENQECIEHALKFDPDVSFDATDREYSELHLAAKLENEAALRYLIQKNPANCPIDSEDEDGQTALWLALAAAQFGNARAVKRLLDNGLARDEVDSVGRTPLWLAVDSTDEQCVSALLSPDANTDLRDDGDVSILDQAINKKALHIIELLLEGRQDGEGAKGSPISASGARVEDTVRHELKHRRPNVNATDRYGTSPLRHALELRAYSIARCLIAAAADIEQTTTDGVTPLWRAVELEDEEAIEILLDAKADVNAKTTDDVTVLYCAVRNNNIRIVKLILGEGIEEETCPKDLSHLDQDPLQKDDKGTDGEEPAREKPLPRQAMRTTNLPDINIKDSDGESVLLRAVINQSLEIVNLLVKKDPDFKGVDYDGDGELGRAAFHDNVPIVQVLLDAGADPHKKSRYGRSPLHWAAFSTRNPESCRIAAMLLSEDADIYATDEDGQTPLHFAISSSNIPFIESLLSAPTKTDEVKARRTININTKFAEDETMLHIAASMGKSEVVNFLLSRNAIVAASNAKGDTALHTALNYEAVSNLLLSKMDPSSVGIKNRDGNTALHSACRHGFTSIVKSLLAKIDPTCRDIAGEKNNRNETPLRIAVEQNEMEIVQLLVNFRSDVKYTEKDEDEWQWLTMEDPSHDVASTARILDSMSTSWKENPEARSETLYWAARNGHRDLVRKVLGDDENLAYKALYFAAVGGQSRIVKFLLKQYQGLFNFSSGAYERRSVQAAARNGHQKTVLVLITPLVTKSLAFDKIKTDSWTPLHWAVIYQSAEMLDIVRHMLMNGADPEVENSGCQSVIDFVQDSRSRFNHLNEEDYTTLVGLLQSPLRIPPKPVPLVDPTNGHPQEAETVCKSFYANLVDFYTAEGRFCTIERKSSIHDVIYDGKGGPDSVMRHAKAAWKLKDIVLENRLRWIHLPANNWIWAEDLMTRIFSESRKSTSEYARLNKFVELNKREHSGRPQSRFMYPSLTFESKNFQSGEGVNIPKLQSDARRRKKAPPQKRSELMQLDKEDGEAQHVTRVNEAGVENPKADITKGVVNAIARNPIQAFDTHVNSLDASKVTKELAGDKAVVPEVDTSHLLGSKLSLCIPYVTFQTVGSHRALRQAIRLAEEVTALKVELKRSESPQGSMVQTDTPILEREISGLKDKKLAEEKIRQQAREGILETEIVQGLILLYESSREFYTVLSTLSTRTICQIREGGEDKLDEWLASLKETHRKMRRSIKICRSHKVLEWLERFFDAIEIVGSRRKNKMNSPKNEELLEFYLNPVNLKGLHPTRTLDQYYYSALEDTSRRDLDQVVRRYQMKMLAMEKRSIWSNESHLSPRDRAMIIQKGIKNEKPLNADDNGWEDDPEVRIAMVDQLWLWVIDDETVITCFPGAWNREDRWGPGTDLLDKVRKHIHTERRPQISSVYHLVTAITSLCVGFVEDCKAHLEYCKDNFLHMFASSISLVADEEVNCFETFKTDLDKERHNIDILKEVKLLEEIKDIRDELSILKRIFEDQRALLGKLLNLVAVSQRPGSKSNKMDPVLHYYKERSDIDLRIEKIEKMEIDATKTYDSKKANLDEAVETSHQATQSSEQTAQSLKQTTQAFEQTRETAKQGRVILVFTLVTIIFLPLSFLTSLYALNVESFPHDGDDFIYPSGWIYPRVFGTSAAIAIPLICLAFYVNRLLEMWHEWRGKKAQDPKVVPDGGGFRPAASPSEVESQTCNGKSH